MLILSGVTLNILFSDSGIIKKAQLAKELSDNSIVEEQKALNKLLEEIEDNKKFSKIYINICDNTGKNIGSGTKINICTDEACTNILKQIEIENNEKYALNNMSEGTYYINMVEVPMSYNKPLGILSFEVTGLSEQTWNITLKKGASLPSPKDIGIHVEFVNSTDNLDSIQNYTIDVQQSVVSSDQNVGGRSSNNIPYSRV